MSKYVTIKMTRKDAKGLGLLICTCGYPENNHYNFGKRECAFTFCGGYEEIARCGKIIKKARKK